jgi:uncharacterized damage-inducible protein DinB
MKNHNQERRAFLKSSAALTTGMAGLTMLVPGLLAAERSAIDQALPPSPEDSIHIVGPKKGYTPQVGTLVSMLTWMRFIILRPVQGMSVEELDYLHDDKSNTIGGMLFHLAATERFYQIHTLDGRAWGDWDEKDKKKFDVASQLGDEARKTIKGNTLDFYLSLLQEVRETTLAEFKKRDDAWLMQTDNFFGKQPTNNYCKWFHVCEHESNHNGQIKWLKSRLPGAKGSGE